VDRILVIGGTLNFDEFRDAWSFRASDVQTLEQAREASADHLHLQLDLSSASRHRGGTGVVQQLREIMQVYRGGRLPIQLDYRSPQGKARLQIADEWRVQPTAELLKRLRHLLGQEAVHVAYARYNGDLAD